MVLCLCWKGEGIVKVEVLGTGCKRCDELYENSVKAVQDFDPSKEIEVQKIGDMSYFVKMGVMVTPSLVINGEVISVGKVLSIEEIKEKIKEYL